MRKESFAARLGQMAGQRVGFVKRANPRLAALMGGIESLAGKGAARAVPGMARKTVIPPGTMRVPPRSMMGAPPARPPAGIPPARPPAGTPPGGPPAGGPGGVPPGKLPGGVPPGGPPPGRPPAGGPGGVPPGSPPPGRPPGGPPPGRPPGGPGGVPPGGKVPGRADVHGTPPGGTPPGGTPPGGKIPTRADVAEAGPMSLRQRLGLGLAGTAGVGGAGTLGAYAAADKDQIGGLDSDMADLDRMRSDYEAEIAKMKSDGNGFWGGGSKAEQADKIKQMEANLASGNFGGGTFGGQTYAQRKAKAQAQADALAEGRQGRGGIKNYLFGYRDQGAVDSAMKRFEGDSQAERFKKHGITGPTGRTATPSGTKIHPLIGTAAVNWDDFRNTYHNPYQGRDWSHLLHTSPSYMQY